MRFISFQGGGLLSLKSEMCSLLGNRLPKSEAVAMGEQSRRGPMVSAGNSPPDAGWSLPGCFRRLCESLEGMPSYRL
jgi:hypothetical protein